MKTNNAEQPSITDIMALDGKIFAMLTPVEMATLDFYRDRGRKFGVSVSILSDTDQDELINTASRQQADEILKRSNSRIGVTVGRNGTP